MEGGPTVTKAPAPTRPTTLIWIDAREAILVRWKDGRPDIDRIRSDVPAHHRSTGHVRQDMTFGPGGFGHPPTGVERHRLEHLDHHVKAVADRLGSDDLLILGPGTTRERLARLVRERDDHQGRERIVETRPSPRQTDPQLVTLLRHAAGDDARRRTHGPHAAAASAAGLAGRPTAVLRQRRRAPLSGAARRWAYMTKEMTF
jgi:hypothetical protein